MFPAQPNKGRLIIDLSLKAGCSTHQRCLCMYCALAMLDIAQCWGYRGLRQPSRSELPVVVSLNGLTQGKQGCIIKLWFVFLEPCVCFFELGLNLQLMEVLKLLAIKCRKLSKPNMAMIHCILTPYAHTYGPHTMTFQGTPVWFARPFCKCRIGKFRVTCLASIIRCPSSTFSYTQMSHERH